MKGILGRKVGMTGVFTTNGRLIPVTVISVEPNIVTQLKTKATDGYDAIQLGFEEKREKLSNKPSSGHVKKANTTPKRFLREIRGMDPSHYDLGQEIKADTFEAGEIVDVQGTSKGKGFQGVIKRWNQSRGPMGHGSQYHRGVGSLGTMLPKRVMPGKKMPGHMGHETKTIQNLEIIKVDMENNLILVKGNVPGNNNSLVIIKNSVKIPNGKNKPHTLVTYKEEPIEEVTEEVIVEEVPMVEENMVEEVPTEEEVTETVADEAVVEEIPVEATEEETVETEESSQA